MSKILEINNLTVSFPAGDTWAQAVKNVSFSISSGETVGLVGESGSGKSVTSLSILKLISKPGRIDSGEIIFQGQNLMSLSERQLRRIRGNRVSMIFQEPMTSLNPVYTIGNQISEVLLVHTNISNRDSRKKAVDLLDLVGIPAASRRIDDYPHMLSGGMRQRVMIAMALACEPDLLIADEPTTALDVTIQAQILDLIGDLQESMGMSVLLITHDLGVVHDRCDRVLMMYGGQIIETASTDDLFVKCRHPYTYGLLKSIPKIGQKKKELYSIPGQVPKLGKFPIACRFSGRCFNVIDKCNLLEPSLVECGTSHTVRCFNQVSRDLHE